LQTLDFYQQGLAVEEIAQKRNLQTNTILAHLAELLEMNQSVDLDRLVPPKRQKVIFEMIAKIGTENGMKPIYESLEENYTYLEIRLVMAKLKQGTRSI
jgi:ATP-dependent DNA helicase RecQ